MFSGNRYLVVFILLLTVFIAGPAFHARDACADEVMVAAAASLSDAFREAAQAFEKSHPGTKILLNLASSGRLCAQIEQGAPVDLYASASQRYMDRLQEDGLIDEKSRKNFAANRIVLVEQAGSSRLKSLNDLLRPDVRHIAIGDPAHVPAGRYAKEALESVGLWDAVQKKLVFGINVRQVRDYAARGEVEAGLVFASDAIVPEVRVAAIVDDKLHTPILYPAAVLRHSDHPNEAERFLVFLLSPQGQRILVKFGFSSINPGLCSSQVYRRCEAEGTQTYFGTSSVRQQSRFGKLASPLRLQMPEI